MPVVDYDDVNRATVKATPKDHRIALMEEFINVEREHLRAEVAAKEASQHASQMSDDLARARAQLHEALGVSEMHAADRAALRAPRDY